MNSVKSLFASKTILFLLPVLVIEVGEALQQAQPQEWLTVGLIIVAVIARWFATQTLSISKLPTPKQLMR